jgi:hypothetical protein
MLALMTAPLLTSPVFHKVAKWNIPRINNEICYFKTIMHIKFFLVKI